MHLLKSIPSITTRVGLSKCQLQNVILMLKTFQKSSRIFRAKTKILLVTCKILPVLAPHHHTLYCQFSHLSATDPLNLTMLQPHWPPCCFCKRSVVHLPWKLCAHPFTLTSFRCWLRYNLSESRPWPTCLKQQLPSPCSLFLLFGGVLSCFVVGIGLLNTCYIPCLLIY